MLELDAIKNIGPTTWKLLDHSRWGHNISQLYYMVNVVIFISSYFRLIT